MQVVHVGEEFSHHKTVKDLSLSLWLIMTARPQANAPGLRSLSATMGIDLILASLIKDTHSIKDRGAGTKVSLASLKGSRTVN